MRLLPGLVAGILAAGLRNNAEQAAMTAAGLAVVLFLYSRARRRTLQYTLLHIAWGLSVMIAARPGLNGPAPEEVLYYSGPAILLEVPQERPRTHRLVVRVFPRNQAGGACRALIYIPKRGPAPDLLPGDRLLLQVRLTRPAPPDPPCAFNYRKFLERRGIHYTGFARQDRWSRLLRYDPPAAPRRMAACLNLRLSDIVDRYFSVKAAPLIQAMVLGNRSALDPGMTTQFSHTGIMHILAVSGLHVSIVWLLMSMVLTPVRRWVPRMRLPTFLLEAAGVWSFAVLTGLGPSVCRAAFMFTLFSLGGISYNRHRSLNITAASALILLLLHPPLLYAAGFQLSYAAVTGIQVWYNKLNSLLQFRTRVFRYCWSVQSVSAAAVLATTPLALFYFSMFPILFPVANMIAVPAAFLIVAGSILVIGLHPFPWAAALAGGWLSQAVSWFLHAISRIAALPLRPISGVHINLAECVLLSTLIMMISAGIHRQLRPIVGTVLALMILCSLLLFRGIRKYELYRAPVIHCLPERDEAMITAGNKAYILLLNGGHAAEDRQWQACMKKQLISRKEVLAADNDILQRIMPGVPHGCDGVSPR